ncbi:copine-9-like [Convolutriloba macropyga]|uniref:copine-9-like n=1 Tax=Convolutriloba macropyga TaxID=536237 RepID=UPI003F527423
MTFNHFIGLYVVQANNGNGDPKNQESLHYFNPAYPFNQFTTAIDAVGQIVEDYDADKLFPVYGFGGRFFGSTRTQDCHPLNDNSSNPHVIGVQGILDAYRYALSSTTLSQPANFAQVINNATLAASEFQSGLHYFILLIITNGSISDMEQTKCAIVEASKYPLSIIIVGVGDKGNFEAMHQLDSDMKMLRDIHGRKTQRDIVQFVPLRDVFGDTFIPSKMIEYQRSLSKKVLAEVPKQVKLYMKFKGIRPIDVYDAFLIDNPDSTTASPIQAPTTSLPSHF